MVKEFKHSTKAKDLYDIFESGRQAARKEMIEEFEKMIDEKIKKFKLIQKELKQQLQKLNSKGGLKNEN